MNMLQKSEKQTLLLLALLCGLSLFVFLGDTLFNTRGEPREAIVAYSMLEHGNWVLPVNNGDEIAFKPPLLHWCVAAISSLVGGVSEYTSRLPSALAVWVMILGGFVFYARRRNVEVALLMGLLTLTCFEVHRAAYACRVDMLLSALVVLALYALYRWTERGLKGIPWLAWALMAGAALTKGPVGVILPCGVAGVYLLLRGYNFFSLLWRFALLAVAALLPLFAWYYAAYLEPHGGERFLQLIYEENVLRFTGDMSYASHINPWYYNVVTIVAGFAPYTLLVLLALPFCAGALKRLFRWPSLRRAFQLRTYREMDDVRLYSLLSFLVIFVFYCIPASKRSVYLLPVYPFLAMFLAEFLLWLRVAVCRVPSRASGVGERGHLLGQACRRKCRLPACAPHGAAGTAAVGGHPAAGGGGSFPLGKAVVALVRADRASVALSRRGHRLCRFPGARRFLPALCAQHEERQGAGRADRGPGARRLALFLPFRICGGQPHASLHHQFLSGRPRHPH